MRGRSIHFGMFLVAATAVALLGCAPSPAMNPDVPGDFVGQTTPELRAGAVDLHALRGKVVVASFFASRCEPCEAEFPELEELYLAHQGEGLRVVGVAEDEATEADSLARFERAHVVTFPQVWDSSHEAARRFRPGNMPWSYVIDRRGLVRFEHAGHAAGDQAALEQEVRLLLAEGV